MKSKRDYDKYNHVTMVIKSHPESDIIIPVDKFIRVEFNKENSMREYVIPEKLMALIYNLTPTFNFAKFRIS